jgi:hypothetical protein
VLCCVFCLFCLRSMSCVPNDASISGLSILGCPFGFLLCSFEHHSLHLFLTLYALEIIEYVCFVISKSERKLQAFCFAISMLNRNLQPLCYFITKSKKKASSFISWHNFVCLYTCILYNGTIVCSLSSVVSGDLYVFLYVN